jgi:hypothetical protein
MKVEFGIRNSEFRIPNHPPLDPEDVGEPEEGLGFRMDSHPPADFDSVRVWVDISKFGIRKSNSDLGGRATFRIPNSELAAWVVGDDRPS